MRPRRQVELNDLMALYELQYADTTGAVVRSEDYWRWIVGRKYAHVVWVACQGETVRGYGACQAITRSSRSRRTLLIRKPLKARCWGGCVRKR